jgi:hypothetical protein
VRTQEERKRASMALLNSHNIRPAKWLPRIGSAEDTVIRTKEEVVRRMLGLLLISLYAEGICKGEDRKLHREWTEKIIQMYDAGSFFTPKERSFLEKKRPSYTDALPFAWQFETMAVMMWALGCLGTETALEIPARMCDAPDMMDILTGFRNYADTLDHAVLREKEAILDQADIFYRYDWVCANELLNDREDNRASWCVVMERHRALNWLINHGSDGPDEWDDVTTGL